MHERQKFSNYGAAAHWRSPQHRDSRRDATVFFMPK
jgi:hypothetical protein